MTDTADVFFQMEPAEAHVRVREALTYFADALFHERTAERLAARDLKENARSHYDTAGQCYAKANGQLGVGREARFDAALEHAIQGLLHKTGSNYAWLKEVVGHNPAEYAECTVLSPRKYEILTGKPVERPQEEDE